MHWMPWQFEKRCGTVAKSKSAWHLFWLSLTGVMQLEQETAFDVMRKDSQGMGTSVGSNASYKKNMWILWLSRRQSIDETIYCSGKMEV